MSRAEKKQNKSLYGLHEIYESIELKGFWHWKTSLVMVNLLKLQDFFLKSIQFSKIM